MASTKFATAALVLMATCAILAPSAWAKGPKEPKEQTFGTSNYDLSEVPVVGTTLINGIVAPITGVIQILNFGKDSSGQLVAIGKLTLVDLSNLTITDFLNNNNVEIPISNLVVLDNKGNIVSENSILDVLGRRRMLSIVKCKVLNLQLGPLNLDVLGLNISLNQVNLAITADPLGGVLGALLCALVKVTTLDGGILILNALLTILSL